MPTRRQGHRWAPPNADRPPTPGTALAEPSWRGPGFDDFARIPLEDGQLWAIPRVDPRRLADLPPALVHAIADVVGCPVVSPGDFRGPTDDEVIARVTAKYLRLRFRIRRLVIELLLANYLLPRSAVEHLVGGRDGGRAAVDPCRDSWLGPVGSAIEATGRESVAMVVARGVPVSRN